MIPPFTLYFYPFLKTLFDKGSCQLSDISMSVAKQLHITDADLQEMTKGGKQTKHSSRIYYCSSYLKKMGLVDAFSIGCYRITERGKDILVQYGENLDLNKLRELPEFVSTQVGKTNNANLVLVKAHKRGDKIIAPYICNSKNLKKDNPNIEKYQ